MAEAFGETFAGDLSRRRFIAGAAAAGLPTPPADSGPARSRRTTGPLDLSNEPVFCAHEHWGSIASFGMEPEGFRPDVVRGALPRRRTHLTDLLLDPYLGGWLRASGFDPDAAARAAGATGISEIEGDAPKAMEVLAPGLARLRLTGAYQCLRRGIRFLHGGDVDDASRRSVERAASSIVARYQSPFAWYGQAMRKAHLAGLLRPVHPEYYYREESPHSAAEEAALGGTLLRIDPLLDLWQGTSPRRDALAACVGIEPTDAASWVALLQRLFDHAAERGCVGIKQLQAYTRSLEFAPVADASVRFRGDLSRAEVCAFQDWLVHACCRLAHDRGWPHQVHVGTHNLPHSQPLPLGSLAARYPGMKLVLLHCWPYLAEAGWLAKHHPNVYLDTCWMPVLNPAFLREALALWLGYVPSHKIFLSQDATSVEMAVGSAMFSREAVAAALAAAGRELGMGEEALREVGRTLLSGNAAALYSVPSR